jgi:hypothetical protein
VSAAVIDLIPELLDEVVRQDAKHGRFTTQTELGASRLALACIEDEIREALDAWRDERRIDGWPETRTEVLQVAACALRAIRDTLGGAE